MTKLCPRGKAAAKRKFKVYPSAYANAYASKICAGKINDPSGVKRKDFKGPNPASAKKGKFMNEIEIERAMRETLKRNRRRHHNRLMDKLQAEIEQAKINEQKFLRGFGEEPVKKRKFGGTSMNEIEKEGQKRKDFKKTRDILMKAREEGGRFSQSDIDIATKQYKKLFDREQGGRKSLADKYFNRKMQEKLRENQGRRTSTKDLKKRKFNDGGINYKSIAGMDSSQNYGGQVGGHSVMGSPVSVDVDGDTLSNPSASAYYKDLLK